MFVALSKTLDLLLAPLTWALLLGLFALLPGRQGRRRVKTALLGLLVLYFASTNLVADALARRVEASAVNTLRAGQYDVVVLLSGEVDADASAATNQVQVTAAADRLLAAYELYRNGRAKQIALVGGHANPRPGIRTEPEWMSLLLQRWGVPADAIVEERTSRNTWENATAAAQLTQQLGWRSMLLVTSAFHQKRALDCFRKAGLAPDAYPVDHRGGSGGGLQPRAESLLLTTDMLRELGGRLVYWVSGYTR